MWRTRHALFYTVYSPTKRRSEFCNSTLITSVSMKSICTIQQIGQTFEELLDETHQFNWQTCDHQHVFLQR